MFQAAAVLVSQLSVKRNLTCILRFNTTAILARPAVIATKVNAKLATKVNAAESNLVAI